MKVFISYGSAADQVTALRLQALAAVNGLSVFVPGIYTRGEEITALAPEIYLQLASSDVVLGVIGTGLTQACSLELNNAISLYKNMIVMCNPAFEPSLRTHFGTSLIVIDPMNPGTAENAILSHLTSMDQNKKMALLGLGTLALGLLIFGIGQK